LVIDDTETSGRVKFQVYLPHAERVELVGDFTEWEAGAIEMRRDHDSGWWTTVCDVTDGDHTFSYLVDGQYWMPDYAASGVHRNEYGRWTSDLCVQTPRRERSPARFARSR
jgi:1,4-alpha-glucan branching enzyme